MSNPVNPNDPHIPAAAHYSEHHSCELCENAPGAWVLGIAYQGNTFNLVLCEACHLKSREHGQLTYRGVNILLIDEETPPSIDSPDLLKLGDKAARWLRG